MTATPESIAGCVAIATSVLGRGSALVDALLESMPVRGPILAALLLLVVVQLALQVTALVQLARTPTERVTLGQRKWLWAVIILLGEMIGPIIWFVAGRSAAPAQDSVPRPDA